MWEGASQPNCLAIVLLDHPWLLTPRPVTPADQPWHIAVTRGAYHGSVGDSGPGTRTCVVTTSAPPNQHDRASTTVSCHVRAVSGSTRAAVRIG